MPCYCMFTERRKKRRSRWGPQGSGDRDNGASAGMMNPSAAAPVLAAPSVITNPQLRPAQPPGLVANPMMVNPGVVAIPQMGPGVLAAPQLGGGALVAPQIVMPGVAMPAVLGMPPMPPMLHTQPMPGGEYNSHYLK